MTRLGSLVLAAACALIAPGCSTLGGLWSSDALDPEEVPGAIADAEAALLRDDAWQAMDLMRRASLATRLPPETRDRVQGLLESSARRRIEQLSAPGSDPDDMAELVDLELPRQIAVQAGLAAARGYVAEDELYDAYAVLKHVDDKFPLHHERAAAAEMLADIGLTLKDDTPTLFSWFDTLDDAQEVLEYVILKHPWARRCDECYEALALMYAEQRDWELAIARSQGLLLNHPDSPLAIQAQARVPTLRLRRLRSPEYDRQELQTARQELQEWLVSHAGHELERQVRLDLADCLRRLYENDMSVSRFYATVDNPFGARRHALRAIGEAKDAGDQERQQEAEAWLASLPPAKNPISGGDELP